MPRIDETGAEYLTKDDVVVMAIGFGLMILIMGLLGIL